MSGKSTYIRSIALMSVMAQVGCFVPAQSASFPLIRQLFARVSMDDSIEANVSTFASEMRETAFILRSVKIQPQVINSLFLPYHCNTETSIRIVWLLSMSLAEAPAPAMVLLLR